MHKASELIFIKILLAHILGSSLAILFENHTYKSIAFYLLSIIFPILLCRSFINKLFNKKYVHFINSTGVYILFISIGYYSFLNFNELKKSNHFSNYAFSKFEAVIINEPNIQNEIIKFNIRVQKVFSDKWIPVTGKVSFIQKNDSTKMTTPKYGETIISNVPINLTLHPLNPGEFDFKFWLSTKNIFHTAFANSNEIIHLNIFQGNILQKLAYELREKQIKKYNKLIKNSEASSIASTLILGYRADLSQETIQSFSVTGTIHALSVSGAHVAIIYIFLNYLFFFLNNKTVLKYIKLALIIILLWLYTFLTGFSPPALRAVIMITLIILASNLNRTSNILNIMAFSAWILLIYNPYYLLDVGFQLSYFAVLGLILLQPIITNLFFFKTKIFNKLWELCAMSFSAQLATLPLSIYYFHQFPVYFLLGNLFIMFPINMIMGLGVLILIPGFEFVGPILQWILEFTYNGLFLITKLPFSSIQGIQIDLFQIFLISAFIILITLGALHKKSKILIMAITCCWIYIIYSRLIYLNRKDQVIIYSLKNNLGIGFIFNHQMTLFTNLNQSEKTFQYVIKPSLIKLKISKTTIKEINLPNPVINHEHTAIKTSNFKLIIIDDCIVDNGLPSGYDLVYFHGKNTLSKAQNIQLINHNKYVIYGNSISNEFFLKEKDILTSKTYFLIGNQYKTLPVLH